MRGMWGNGNFERVYQTFADQFSPEGSGFVYRKSMKGAPIAVTMDERDAFIGQFRKHVRFTSWAMMIGFLLVLGLLVAVGAESESELYQIEMYAGIGVVCAIYMFMFFWVWNAPSRALARRAVLGNALTKAEARKLALSRMTYGQLAGAVALALFLVWKASEGGDLMHGWGIASLVFAGGMTCLAAVQAFRKWRMERRGE